MHYSEDIIKKIGTDKELAVRLGKAMAGVKDGFIDYLINPGDGATRALYYTSCLQKIIKMFVNSLKMRTNAFYWVCMNLLSIEI